MREIKFRYRIQDIKTKSISFLTLTLTELEEGRYLSVCTPTYDKIKILSRDEYTDLKDKNGIEIYEGDIIKIDWTPQQEDLRPEKPDISIWAVEWFVDDITCGWNTDPSDAYFGEVIGNIYENSELLKENNARD